MMLQKEISTFSIFLVLVVSLIHSSQSIASEISLTRPSESLSSPNELSGKQGRSNATSVIESFGTVFSMVSSCLKGMSIAKSLVVGIALLPYGHTFSATNPSWTGGYTSSTSSILSLKPIVIQNASATEKFDVSIRISGLKTGALGSWGRSSIVSSSSSTYWNVSGSAQEINALTSFLFVESDFNVTTLIQFFPLITSASDNKTDNSVISLTPVDFSASNRHQSKTYKRNGGPIFLDPIVLNAGAKNDSTVYSFRFAVVKEAGDLSLSTVGNTIQQVDGPFLGIYSRSYTGLSLKLSDITTLLSGITFTPVKDFFGDTSIWLELHEGTPSALGRVLYSVIMVSPLLSPIPSTVRGQGTEDFSTTGSTDNTILMGSSLFTLVISDRQKMTLALVSDPSSSNVSSMTDLKLDTSARSVEVSAIVGGVVGFIILGGCVVALVVCLAKKKTRNTQDGAQQQVHASQYGDLKIVPNGQYDSVGEKFGQDGSYGTLELTEPAMDKGDVAQVEGQHHDNIQGNYGKVVGIGGQYTPGPRKPPQVPYEACDAPL